MNPFYPTATRGGLLTRHLGRLAAALGSLTERTRAAVAQSLAGAAADLVGDAVRLALAARGEGQSDRWQRPDGAFDPPRRSEYDPWYAGGDDPDWAEEDDWREPPEPPEPAVPSFDARPVGLALGLQAAAWCLCRRSRRPLLTALGAGAGVWAVATTGGPLVVAGLRLAGCLLALNSLDAAARSADTFER